MTLSAPIFRLKRNAKLLSREAEIPLNQALEQVAKKEGYQSWGLLIKQNPTKTEEVQQRPKPRPDTQITSLPLSKDDRAEFIEAANSVFKSVMQRIQPDNPKQTRKLWDVEDYVDNHLQETMLPISKSYALSLIDSFLVHHVIGLAMQADQMVGQPESKKDGMR